jgi:hypothetical protein
MQLGWVDVADVPIWSAATCRRFQTFVTNDLGCSTKAPSSRRAPYLLWICDCVVTLSTPNEQSGKATRRMH